MSLLLSPHQRPHVWRRRTARSGSSASADADAVASADAEMAMMIRRKMMNWNASSCFDWFENETEFVLLPPPTAGSSSVTTTTTCSATTSTAGDIVNHSDSDSEGASNASSLAPFFVPSCVLPDSPTLAGTCTASCPTSPILPHSTSSSSSSSVASSTTTTHHHHHLHASYPHLHQHHNHHHQVARQSQHTTTSLTHTASSTSLTHVSFDLSRPVTPDTIDSADAVSSSSSSSSLLSSSSSYGVLLSNKDSEVLAHAAKASTDLSLSSTSSSSSSSPAPPALVATEPPSICHSMCSTPCHSLLSSGSASSVTSGAALRPSCTFSHSRPPSASSLLFSPSIRASPAFHRLLVSAALGNVPVITKSSDVVSNVGREGAAPAAGSGGEARQRSDTFSSATTAAASVNPVAPPQIARTPSAPSAPPSVDVMAHAHHMPPSLQRLQALNDQYLATLHYVRRRHSVELTGAMFRQSEPCTPVVPSSTVAAFAFPQPVQQHASARISVTPFDRLCQMNERYAQLATRTLSSSDRVPLAVDQAVSSVASSIVSSSASSRLVDLHHAYERVKQATVPHSSSLSVPLIVDSSSVIASMSISTLSPSATLRRLNDAYASVHTHVHSLPSVELTASAPLSLTSSSVSVSTRASPVSDASSSSSAATTVLSPLRRLVALNQSYSLLADARTDGARVPLVSSFDDLVLAPSSPAARLAALNQAYKGVAARVLSAFSSSVPLLVEQVKRASSSSPLAKLAHLNSQYALLRADVLAPHAPSVPLSVSPSEVAAQRVQRARARLHGVNAAYAKLHAETMEEGGVELLSTAHSATEMETDLLLASFNGDDGCNNGGGGGQDRMKRSEDASAVLYRMLVQASDAQWVCRTGMMSGEFCEAEHVVGAWL